MRKIWLAFVIAGLMAGGSVRASASTALYSSGLDYGTFFWSDSQNPSGSGSPALAYTQFTLTSDATITGMEWQGLHYPGDAAPTGDSFDYAIWSEPIVGGQPGVELAGGPLTDLSSSGTGGYDFGMDVYKYDAAPSSPIVPLAAGPYYLSIYDTVLNPGNAFGWVVGSAGVAGTSAWVSSVDEATWTSMGEYTLAVNLTGNVATPEPVSMVFFGTGLVAVGGFMARRRMQHKA